MVRTFANIVTRNLNPAVKRIETKKKLIEETPILLNTICVISLVKYKFVHFAVTNTEELVN